MLRLNLRTLCIFQKSENDGAQGGPTSDITSTLSEYWNKKAMENNSNLEENLSLLHVISL